LTERLSDIVSRTVLIALASYGLSVLCGIDSMARKAWHGNYPVYIAIFLFLSTVAQFVIALGESRKTFFRRPLAGFVSRIVFTCVASWISLIFLSYIMATNHNRYNLEFMTPGIHFLLEAYMSGAILYGVVLACVNLYFTSSLRHYSKQMP